MNWNLRIRQVHRWLSIAFTAAVVLNIVFMVRKEPSVWVGFLALVPLIPLLLTGLYMFVQPYAARGRSRAAES